jgi:hypothetical protein
MFAKIFAVFQELYNRVAYPAPKCFNDVIAKALHKAKDDDEKLVLVSRHCLLSRILGGNFA